MGHSCKACSFRRIAAKARALEQDWMSQRLKCLAEPHRLQALEFDALANRETCTCPDVIVGT